jgi:hypothetical protein
MTKPKYPQEVTTSKLNGAPAKEPTAWSPLKTKQMNWGYRQTAYDAAPSIIGGKAVAPQGDV